MKGAAGGLTMAPVFFRLAIDQANAAGGTDNITAMVVECRF